MPNELLGWDADFYNSLPDTTRNVSLSDKEIYVLGNLLPLVSFANRWSGDISGIDIDAIRGDMEFTILDEIEGGAMSCVDVVDCIENDTSVQDAIEQSLIADGFSPNSETNITEIEQLPTLSTSEKAQNLLPDSLVADCAGQPEIAMGIARTVVRELHETAEDTLELLEYATNTLEAWSSVSAIIPAAAANVITQGLDWVDWLLETFKELYEAAYNQSVEDELSCAIFCHIMDTCSLSLTDLENIYQSESAIGTPPDGIIDTLEFIYSIAVSANKIAVASFHYQILRLLSWGEFGGVSAPYIKSLLKSAQGGDYSYEDLCEDCTTEIPTDYWMIHYDWRTGGKQGTGIVVINGSGNDGIFNNGYATNPAVPNSLIAANYGVPDLGAAYVIRAFATRSVRRGSDANGTHDFSQLIVYPNANYTGTPLTFNANFIAGNTNAVEVGVRSPVQPTAYRSWKGSTRVNELSSTGLGVLRTYEQVIWGLAGAGNTKPPRSKWMGNVLPATVPELFPDYVAP